MSFGLPREQLREIARVGEDPREDVRVGIGDVEFQLKPTLTLMANGRERIRRRRRIAARRQRRQAKFGLVCVANSYDSGRPRRRVALFTLSVIVSTDSQPAAILSSN